MAELVVTSEAVLVCTAMGAPGMEYTAAGFRSEAGRDLTARAGAAAITTITRAKNRAANLRNIGASTVLFICPRRYFIVMLKVMVLSEAVLSQDLL